MRRALYAALIGAVATWAVFLVVALASLVIRAIILLGGPAAYVAFVMLVVFGFCTFCAYSELGASESEQ